MKLKFIPLLLIVFAIAMGGCEKDENTPFNSCEKINSGLTHNSSLDMRSGINQLITELPSADYNGPNLDSLALRMTNSCGVTASVTCLNCNHQSPFYSEITVDYTSGGSAAQKIISITYDAANKMRFHSMRD